MQLKICDENLLFIISNANFINIICFFAIFFCVIFCYVIQRRNSFVKNRRNNKMKKTIVFLTSFSFLIFLVFVFISTLNAKAFEGCSCALEEVSLLENKSVTPPKINNITNNKVIVVGDSRMEYIANDNNLNIPINFSFIALSGTSYAWFHDEAINELTKKLDNRKSGYRYHVIMNMGVNDLDTAFYQEVALKYFDDYKKLAFNYPDVDFYLLSVNPIIERTINRFFPYNNRTNDKIVSYNNIIESLSKDIELINMNICDSYNNIKFLSKDGLHYTRYTNQQILDFISNKCLKY